MIFNDNYNISYIPKKSGGKRKIYSYKEARLKNKHKKVAARVLEDYVQHECSYAYLGKQVHELLEKHMEANVMLIVDLKNFFESIPVETINYRLLHTSAFGDIHVDEIGLYKRQISTTGLFHTKVQVPGIPMGSVLAPLISELAMINVDNKLEYICVSADIVYTRYSDDMQFSSKRKLTDKEIEKLLDEIKNTLMGEYQINDSKTRVYRRGVDSNFRLLGMNFIMGKYGNYITAGRRRKKEPWHYYQLGKGVNSRRYDGQS